MESKWEEKDGIIRLCPIVSDGVPGLKCEQNLRRKGQEVDSGVSKIFESPRYKTTNGVTHWIVILRDSLFGDEDGSLNTDNVRFWAEKFGLTSASAETAYLIREKFSNAEIESMALRYIIIMHEAIDYKFLTVEAKWHGLRMGTYREGPYDGWINKLGFAFQGEASS